MTDVPIDGKLLAKIPAFRGLTPDELDQLRGIVRSSTFQPGDRILVQGKQKQYLWFVVEGKCRVMRDTKRDGPEVLAELEPYSLFGEMSFFSPAPHSANVVAETSLTVVSISRADYDDLIRDGVVAAYKLAYNILESVAQKLRRMDRRIADLVAEQDDSAEGDHERLTDWRKFRENLLDSWNL